MFENRNFSSVTIKGKIITCSGSNITILNGSIDCGGSIECGNISGDIDADGSVRCKR